MARAGAQAGAESPQGLTHGDRWRMSALPPKADMSDRTGRSALCQKRTNAPQQKHPLFDHLVGAGEQGRWHVEAERLSGLEIHDEFEFRGLFDRELGRFRTLENFVDVIT